MMEGCSKARSGNRGSPSRAVAHELLTDEPLDGLDVHSVHLAHFFMLISNTSP